MSERVGSDPITVAQRFDALRYNIIAATLSFDIFKHYDIAQDEGKILRLNWFDAGVMRACLRDAILALARIVDGHKDALSLEKLLNYAEQHPEEFGNATPADVRDRAKKDRQYILEHDLIAKIRAHRDTMLAHSDRRVYRDPSTMIGSLVGTAELEPMLAEVLEIINAYSNYFDGSCLMLEEMRGGTETGFADYVDFRQARVTQRLAALNAYRNDVMDCTQAQDETV